MKKLEHADRIMCMSTIR